MYNWWISFVTYSEQSSIHMLSPDDIVLADKSVVGISFINEFCKQTLESKGFKLRRNKIEFMYIYVSTPKRT